MTFDRAKAALFYENQAYSYSPAGQVSDAETVGAPDDIRFVNHYIFGGRRDFSNPFQVLVAGGGPGERAWPAMGSAGVAG